MLFPVINQLLDIKQDVVLPESKNEIDLANAFMKFFR